MSILIVLLLILAPAAWLLWLDLSTRRFDKRRAQFEANLSPAAKHERYLRDLDRRYAAGELLLKPNEARPWRTCKC